MAVETPGAPPPPTGLADPVSDLNSILQNPAVAPRQKEIQDTFAQQKMDRDQLQTYIQSLPLDADSKTRMWKSYWSYPSAPAPKPAAPAAPAPALSLLSRATDYASKKISGAESAIVGGVASGLPMPTPPALPVPPVPSGVKMSVQSPVASVGSVDQKPPLSLGRPRTLMAGVPTVPPVLPKSDYAGVSPKVAGIHETKDGYNVVMDDGMETTLPLHDVPFFKEYPRLTNADVYGLRNPGLKGPTAPVSPDQKFQAIDPKLDENGKFRPAAIWEQQPPKPDTSWWDVLKEAPGAISQVGKESRKKTTWESFRDTYATVVNGAARVLSDVTLGHYDADKGTLTFPQSMLSMPGMPGHPTPLGKLVPSGTVQLRDMSVSDILEHYWGVPADLAHDGTAAQIGSLIGIAKPWGEISKVLEAGTALTEANALAKIGEEGLLDGRAAAKAADITKRMLRNAGLQAASGEIVGHLEAAPPNETAAERELRAGKNALYGAGFSVLLDSVAHLWAALPKGAKGSTTAAVREPFDKVVNDIYDLFYKSGTFSSEEAAQAAADKTLMSGLEQTGLKKVTVEEIRDSVRRRFEANKAAGESVSPETPVAETPASAPAETHPPVTTPVQTGPATTETAGIPQAITGPEKPPSTELPAPPEIPSETSRIPRPKKQFTHNGQEVRGISGVQVVLANGTTAERAPAYIETLRKYGYTDLTPEQIQGLKGPEAPAADPTKDLPSDVTYLGPQEVPDGKPLHLYNLELPDGTQATFAVREGQDVGAKAFETRRNFQEGGNGQTPLSPPEAYLKPKIKPEDLPALTQRAKDLSEQIDAAYEDGKDPSDLEAELDPLVQRLSEHNSDLEDDQRDESPGSLEEQLATNYAELRAWDAGDKTGPYSSREDILGNMRSNVWDAKPTPVGAPTPTDEQLIAAAKDAHETIQRHRERLKMTPNPGEIDRVKDWVNKLSKKKTASQSAGMEGANPEETKAIAEEFIQRQGDREVTRIFDAPKKGEIVRIHHEKKDPSGYKNKVWEYQKKNGWMTVDEAKQQIELWKQHAAAQGETGANSNKVVLSLFDRTGEWAKPWVDAGYQVHTFDIQNDPEFGDIKNFSAEFFMDMFGDFEGQDVHAVIAACPCTDFAVSGAKFFAAKDADGRTVDSIQLVRATLATIEYFKPAIWAVENPVGRIEKLAGLPPWRMSFDPNAFGDPYTKKTLLWGRFNGDLPIAPVEPVEGSKMHSQYGGKSQATKNARSVTPEGFAYSFFMANNAVDHPEMTAANKYDRLDKGLIDRAIAAGLTLEDIDHAVDDDYYQDLNDKAAEKHLQEAIDAKKGGAASSLPPVPPVPSTKSGKARAPKSYVEAQKQIDRFEDRIEEKYGKSALKELMLAETNASLGFTKESHPNIPHPSIDFTPDELAESKRLYEERDALDQADVETNVKEIDQKFKPLIPDAAARQKLVRELAQADIPTALRSEYQTGEKWRDIGKAVNIIVQYISKHVTHDVEQTAFHVSSVLDPNWDPKTGATPVPTRIRIESERSLGPSQATLDEAQRWMDHLYPDDPPKIPGAKAQARLPEVPEPSKTSAIADTTKFKKWFKGSKVVDDAGAPLLVHHQTWTDFDEFDRMYGPNKLGRNPEGLDAVGHWFTDDPDLKRYGPRNVDAYLSIQNPKIYEDDPGTIGGSRYDPNKSGGAKLWLELEAIGGATKYREKLAADGFDGIHLVKTIMDGTPLQSVWITLEPTQIKIVGKSIAPGKEQAVADSDRYLRERAEQEKASGGLPEVPSPASPASEPPPVVLGPRAAEIVRYHGLVDKVYRMLKGGQSIDNPRLTTLANEAFGGTRGAGKYDPKDAYDAVEAAINMVIRELGFVDFNDIPGTLERMKELESRIPRQTDRTTEGIEYQQFSTPPAEALAAVMGSGIRPGMLALEPSAGTANVATIMKLAGADVVTNEITPRRQALLEMQGFKVYSVDAQYLNNLLPFDIEPDVVVMNPPFSSTGGRTAQHKTIYGAEHVTQALARVKPGGRVVAIVGRGMAYGRPSFDKWWQKIEGLYTVRANIGIDGKYYGKYGTGFDNQILVIDKTGPTPGATRVDRIQSVIQGENLSPEQAVKLLEPLGKEDIRERISSAAKSSGKPTSSRLGGRTPEGLPAPPAVDIGVSIGGGGLDSAPAGDGGAGSPAMGHLEQPLAPQSETGVGDVGGTDAAGGLAGAAGPVESPEVGGATGSPVSTGTEPGDGLERAEESSVQGEAESEIYTSYVVRKARFAKAAPHPANIVESATMASVEPPDVQYTPNLPTDLVKSGKVSDVQLEAITYAGQKHQQILASGKRAGYWIGDGTGVGKGREIAGILFDNLQQGRKRAVWFSVTAQLRVDAERDIAGVGLPMKFIAQQDSKTKEPAPEKDGVMFTTYSLAAGDWSGGRPRYKQLTDWMGPDFDGVIIFDEAHTMKNAVMTNIGGQVPASGKQEGTDAGAMGIALSEQFPKARIVYVSATAATVPRNLAYMDRIGMWGPGAPFPDFVSFLSAMNEGGVGAMEMLSRDLKAVGSYISRSISYKGVGYEQVEHVLTDEETVNYNHLADVWSEVMQAFSAAAANAGQPKGGARNQMSAFYSSQQRFFLQVITSLQLPDLFQQADADLEAGRSVVISLYNTNEGQTAKKVAEALASGTDLEDLDFTPREILINLIKEYFPVEQWTTIRDPLTGKDKPVRMEDAAGNPVINRENQKIKEDLMDRLADIKVPDNPLDAIVNHFGARNISEVTGRKKRLVGGKYEARKIKDVPLKERDATEVKRFQDGIVKVAVISGKASAGISLHSSKQAANKSRRVFYAMQLSWSADKQMQSFGRVHRSDQVQPPIIKLVLTSLKGQQRLVNTVASRLASLGALTEGSRESKGGGLFALQDITDQHGTAALLRTYADAMNQRIPSLKAGPQLLKRMGVLDKDGNVRDQDLSNVERFLNRIMALHVDEQNGMFNHFFEIFQGIIAREKEAGTFDVGVTKIPAKNVSESSPPQIIHTDPKSGARTSLLSFGGDFPVNRMSWQDIQDLHAGHEASRNKGYHVNKTSGRLYSAGETRPGAYGETKINLYSPKNGYHQTITHEDLQEKYSPVDTGKAANLWAAEHGGLSGTERRPIYLIDGAIFPIYDRVMGQGGLSHTKVVRVELEGGGSKVGLQVVPKEIEALKQRLGIGTPLGEATPQQIYDLVKNSSVIELNNGWEIKQTKVHGEARIEIDPGSRQINKDEMANAGVISETINYSRRYFVPLDDEVGPGVLGKILEFHKAVRDKTAGGPATKGASKGSNYVVAPASPGVPPAIAGPKASTRSKGSRGLLSSRDSVLPVPKPPITINGKTYDPTVVKISRGTEGNVKEENVAGWEIAPGIAVTDGDDGKYNVTHTQSGLAVSRNFDSVEQATAYAERLAKVTDWTRSKEDLESDLDLRAKMKQIAGERGSIPFFSKKAPDPIPDNQLKFSTKESNDVVALEPQDRKNLWERVNGFAKYAQKFHNAVVYNGDIEMWPVFAEQVRRAQELAADAAGQTQTKMQEILKGLSPNEENVARRIVYFEDMYETATRLGEDRIPLELNSQFANKLDQMDHDLDHLHSIATPAVEQSVERFHDWMNEVRDNLVSRGKMSADHGYERYFPNQFLHSSGNERLPGMPTRLQEPWRGYTQARKGHVIPHDPDWIRVMEKYGTRFYLDNAIDDFIRSTSESHDFKQWLSGDQMKKLMAETHGELKADHVYTVDLADLTPQQIAAISTAVYGGPNYTGKLPSTIKLTGFQFNPNPVFYPAQAIVEQVITDAINAGLEELGIDLNKLRDTAAAQGRAPGELPRPPELQTVMEEPLTKGVLALGSEHKMYLLPVEVAQRLKNFRQAGIVGPFTEFARAATQAWKASVIHFSGGAYYTHVTLGNEITLFAEDTMALAKQPQALAMLRKKLTPPQYAQMIRLFEDARVWNSVFYTGSTRPATTTIPDIRKYRPAQGLSRLNPFGENVLGDALREWQRYGQIVQVVPKLAKFLADMERVEQGQPIVNSAVNMHGLDPASVLAAGKNARENVHPDYRGVAPGMRGFYTAFPFAAYHMKIVAPWLRRASAKGWAFPGDKFLALIGGLYVSAWIWNHFMYPQDEHELPPWQKEMLHINTGLRDASGKILSVGMEIPTDIIARWGGLHTVSENLDKVREGTWTLEQAAEQQAKDVFGHQKLSLLPTAPAAMLQKLFNPVLMAITEMYANKDSQTGHEIVPKSNRSLWGDPSAAWPQTETGDTMMSEHFVKRLISPYMQFLRAAQSDDPDSAFSTWLTDSGPFSWKRALGVRKAVPGAGDSADWYSDSDLQQSLYEEKIKKMSDAYVQWAGGNISAEQRDAMIAPILDQAGPNPTFSAATGESDLQKLQARPQYKIWVAEETLRKTADPQERRDLQDQISALRYQIARDNYKNLPEPVKKVVPVPPVPVPLPPVPNP